MSVEVAVDLEKGPQHSIIFADGLDALHFLFLSTYIIPILPSENDNERNNNPIKVIKNHGNMVVAMLKEFTRIEDW